MTHRDPGTRSGSTSGAIGLEAPLLLLLNGGLLSVTVILSRLAATEGAAMLWFLASAMAGAGLILFGVAILKGQARGAWRRRILYSLGAGAFQALGMALAYLSVPHVGVGYVSLAFAFPLLMTYLMALGFGMERFVGFRALGVAVSLAGGLMIAVAKAGDLSGIAGALVWILAASAIPLVLAGGNLYRTRFWPTGAPPTLLAALMMLCSALFVAPVAALTEGTAAASVALRSDALALLMAFAIATFSLKYVVYFQLQKVAGPVYLSQIGFVAAAIGAPVAFIFFGESVPAGFPIAVVLILAGAALFQVPGRRKTKAAAAESV